MKRNLVSALLVCGALAAGGAAAYFADAYVERSISQRRAELDAQYKHISVVVANADLRPGVSLSGRTAALRDVPRAFLRSDAVRAESWGDVVGRTLVRAIRSGETVLMSDLAQNAGAGFSAQLPAGMRALTLPVDEEASISGMLAPGDFVDILFTTSHRNEPITAPLLLNVPVIATGIRTLTNDSYFQDRERSGQYRTVTVSVTPQDAAKITLAQDAGKITIALRRPHDPGPSQIAQVTRTALLSDMRTKSVAAGRGRIQIILGGS